MRCISFTRKALILPASIISFMCLISTQSVIAQDNTPFSQKQRYYESGLDCKSKKSKVMNVQSALIDRGYDAGGVDGVMGKQTRAALKVFQYENGDYPDGLIQKSVLKKLGINC